MNLKSSLEHGRPAIFSIRPAARVHTGKVARAHAVVAQPAQSSVCALARRCLRRILGIFRACTHRTRSDIIIIINGPCSSPIPTPQPPPKFSSHRIKASKLLGCISTQMPAPSSKPVALIIMWPPSQLNPCVAGWHTRTYVIRNCQPFIPLRMRFFRDSSSTLAHGAPQHDNSIKMLTYIRRAHARARALFVCPPPSFQDSSKIIIMAYNPAI